MWNLTYTNKFCNKKDKLKDHMTHVNKLMTVRSIVDTSTPYQPNFLKSKKQLTQIKIDSNIKMNYENRNLLEKITKIERNFTAYHPYNLIVKECPSFRKTNFVRHLTNREIHHENKVTLFNY